VHAPPTEPPEGPRPGRPGEPESGDATVFEVPDTLGDAFVALDQDWRIRFVGSSGAQLSPTRCQELSGHPFWELWPERGAPGQRALYHRCMEARLPVGFLEHLSSLDVWTEVRAYPTADGGISVFFRDVTAQKRAEAECAEAVVAGTEEKKRADLEQRLIGIVSHDLRNPLQAIRLSAGQGLRGAGQDPRQRRQFERIINSSDRALRMINDLLDFTRVREGGGLAVEPVPVDLHALTAQVVDEVLITRPERHVALETQGEAQGLWDADRLAQVVQNLVGNALQHTTEDAAVRVRTRGEARHVVLEVHNTGPAISTEDLPRLFEPFQRGRDARAGGGRSMGLGLHITSHIVQAHGGTIEVRSSEEEGTTFTVRLPRRTPTEPGPDR
jgi:sigma-B regulation protein RsbU (phosphoserine phosphatase)